MLQSGNTEWRTEAPEGVAAFGLGESRLREKRLRGLGETPGRGDRPGFRSGLGRIIGQSSAMHPIYELIVNAAGADVNVIIYGESGTGKELVAHAIHEVSRRKSASFVPVNCGAIPETLMESEFFGHRKGAFTGAVIDKHGFLDLANGGTLFLDELGDIGHGMQVKLLRAIDGGGYTPIGGTQVRRAGRAHHRRHQPRHRRAGAPRWSGKTFSIAFTSSPFTCRPCGSDGRTSRCWSSTSSRFSAGRAAAADDRASWRPSWLTVGPGTCASSRTPSTAT